MKNRDEHFAKCSFVSRSGPVNVGDESRVHKS
jgi:hypothetical protein